jgi:hypothetical protein
MTPTNSETPTMTPTYTSTPTPSPINCTQWVNLSGIDAFYDWQDCDGTLHLNQAIPNNISICALDGTVSFISGGVLTSLTNCS